MRTLIYCFRDDLRLHDNPALHDACQRADRLLPVWLIPDRETARWGFARVGERRQAFRASAAAALDAGLRKQGSRLLVRHGSMARVLPQLAAAVHADEVCCEEIATPYEQDEVLALRAQGVPVAPSWQSTLYQPFNLPWAPDDLPDVFTHFRQALDRAGLALATPLPAVALPALPRGADAVHGEPLPVWTQLPDPRSGFPFPQAPFLGGEDAAKEHLTQYLARGLVHGYKTSRNGLMGVDYSSKLSPWFACGALSPRTVWQQLVALEASQGPSEGSAWLRFELLWRDYFKLLSLKYGRRLFAAGGLPGKATSSHDARAFARWMAGDTGHALVDAGMRELAATGYLGNRMRQIVASYLIHDLHCDWRAGAAWFESALIDYDCSLNQGNWLYIAGLGTDPRGGRRFNPDKQAAEYDPDGAYRRAWGTL